MAAKKVIHLNDKIRLAGGVEVYLEQLQRLLPQVGWQSKWLGVQRNGRQVKLERFDDPARSWSGTVAEFKQFLAKDLAESAVGLLHVHSISDPELIYSCFNVAPVVRTMHEPRMFCPGQGKFWSRSEIPCTKPFGAHCLWHAYTEKCCNRHPKRLLAALRNTHFEIREASARYAAIIANSNYIRQEAMQAGIPGKKIQVLPYFAEDKEPVSPVSHTDVPRIFFAGRLSKTKGVHYLLQAFAKVLKQFSDAHLDIVGAGIDEHFFERHAQELNVARAVTFHGWCNRARVAELIDASTVVAFPSIYPEAFGVVGIEAMMRGKPVVAFDGGGIRDWLRDGDTGFLVPSKEVESFASAIRKLLEEQELHNRMSSRARQIASKNFSSDRHIEELSALYERAFRVSAAGI